MIILATVALGRERSSSLEGAPPEVPSRSDIDFAGKERGRFAQRNRPFEAIAAPREH